MEVPEEDKVPVSEFAMIRQIMINQLYMISILEILSEKLSSKSRATIKAIIIAQSRSQQRLIQDAKIKRWLMS